MSHHTLQASHELQSWEFLSTSAPHNIRSLGVITNDEAPEARKAGTKPFLELRLFLQHFLAYSRSWVVNAPFRSVVVE